MDISQEVIFIDNMTMEELRYKYNRVQRKVRIYGRAARTGYILSLLGTALMFMSAIPMIPIYLQMWFDVSTFLTWPLCVLGSGILMIAGRQINRSRGIIRPSTCAEERTFLKIYEALRILEVYIQDELPASRGEAVRKLRRVSNEMLRGDDWKIGDLLILKETVGYQIESLKNGFEGRLIPTIMRGDDQSIKKAYSILMDFANYLINPKIDKLVSINDMIGTLPYTEDRTPRWISLARKTMAYPLVKHVIVVGTGLAICILAYFIGTAFFYVSKENAFISAVGLLGTFMSGYMALISKRKGS
jgi:hypothetical protein